MTRMKGHTNTINVSEMVMVLKYMYVVEKKECLLMHTKTVPNQYTVPSMNRGHLSP